MRIFTLSMIHVFAVAWWLTGCSPVSPTSLDHQFDRLEEQGLRSFGRGDFQQARSIWDKGYRLAQQNNRDDRVAAFLVHQSSADESVGDYRLAIEHASAGLKIAQRLGNRMIEARAMTNLALSYRRLGEYALATSYSEKALEFARQLGNLQLQSSNLRNLGAIAQAKGNDRTALQYYEQGLPLAVDTKDSIEQAKTLNNMGGAYRRLGQYQTALKYYEQSLSIREQKQDLPGQGKVLGNLCLVYQNLRDYPQALEYCKRALALADQQGDKAREANHFNNIGAIHRAIGEFEQAIQNYRRSVELKRQIGDRPGEGRGWNNLGELYWQTGRTPEAMKAFTKAMDIHLQTENLAGQSAVQLNLGGLYAQLEDYPKALEHYHSALMLQSELGEPEQRWRVLAGLSRVHVNMNQPLQAIFFGKQAVNTIQSVRANILELEKTLQRSFLEDKIRVYRDLADLLIDEGRLWEAQQVLAMLKEEEYFDFTRGRDQDGPPATSVPYSEEEQLWQRRYAQIVQDLGKIRTEYSELKRKGQKNRTANEEERFLELKKVRNELSKRHRVYLEELTDYFANAEKDVAISFAEANLKKLKGLRSTLKFLGKDVVAVHYLVTKDKLRIIVTGPDESIDPIHVDSAIDQKNLNHLILQFRDSLQTPQRDPLPAAHELYEYLIEPIDSVLQAFSARILVIYLSDSLRYLPLSALHDGRHYLAERYALARYIAGAENMKDAPASQWRIAGLGVSQGVPALHFDALPAVVGELNGIVRENEEDLDGILPGNIYIDGEFTSEQLAAVLDSDCDPAACYQVVHLSTHFNFVPGTYEDSFLLLGNGKILNLADLLEGDYQFGTVDLLTLSACETALAGDDARGREVESFGTLVLNGGAKAVLATLWKVADLSTATFMEQFYKLRQQGNSKAEALQKAQLAFITGTNVETKDPGRNEARGTRVISGNNDGDFHPDPQTPYAHPFYWAPFILMGNIR